MYFGGVALAIEPVERWRRVSDFRNIDAPAVIEGRCSPKARRLSTEGGQ